MRSGGPGRRRKLERENPPVATRGSVAMHVQLFTKRICILVLAVCLTVAGLFLAVFIGGPITRALFGIPPGFHDHFVSSEGQNQALVVQFIAVGTAFLLLGMVMGPKVAPPRLPWALLAANPITVGVGFVVFKLSYQALHLPVHETEYYLIGGGALLALTSPVIFALCFGAGAYMSDRRMAKSALSKSA